MPCPECEGMLVTAARGAARCTVCKWKGDPPGVESEAAQSQDEAEREPATVGD